MVAIFESCLQQQSSQTLLILLQPLRWCCVDCVIHHERDVREEQHHTYVARTSNKRVIVAWKLCRY